MKKLISLLIAIVLCFATLTFAACKDGVDGKDGADGANGKDGINGINGTNGKDGDDGDDGTNGKSAYELFVEQNPSYTGDESQWLEDLAAGRLKNEYRYNIISYGKNIAGEATVGTVNYVNGSVTLIESIIKFDTPAVMPVTEGSEWEINMGGILADTGSPVQLLTSSENTALGRIYFAVNADRNIAYMGANIGGIYFNYCWNVPGATIRSNHEYTLRYKDGLYTLSVDGGDHVPFASLNQNQTDSVTLTNPQLASAELNEKIRAITGQEYFTFVSMGANGFKCTGTYDYLDITTSSVYGYEELSKHPLYGKTVYHLGSSISYGSANNGVSFADQIASLTGSKCVKETVSGTTLSSAKDNSYVQRLSNFTFTDNPSFLVLQLSTNDFSQGITAGSVSSEEDWAYIDTTTLTGAIEYIIGYVNEYSPETKVIIYTCYIRESWGNRQAYSAYINSQLKQIEAKWGITVVDLFNKQAINTNWMADDIHPNGAQYANMFTPAMINHMVDLLAK